MSNIVHKQIKLAKESLKKRRKFESGWYEKRIAELNRIIAEKNQQIDNLIEECGLINNN